MTNFKFFPDKLSPYVFIAITGLLGFAPVSFMIFGLKNDILTIEYPIKYFISECIHNGEAPVWFNTWALGFPLQSNLTWGIFSTPQFIVSSVFSYNIYVLHFEFIFYVLLSGWSMFYLLKRHFLDDEQTALILACSYMLSGFIVGSSQWLLYITTASFAPLLLHALLQLLNSPSLRHAFLFGVIYYLMFTSVYQAFNIISSYCIAAFTIYWLIRKWDNIVLRKRILLNIFFAAFFTVVLCVPCLYYTIEVLHDISRGEAIASHTPFFNSNYLPPASLASILFPLSSVKSNFLNTEGTMFNCYTGLFALSVLPSVLIHVTRTKNWKTLSLFLVAIVFVLISFGDILPVRTWLNFLPGLSYFRNPGIFRFYFILFLLLFLAASLKEKSISDIFHGDRIFHVAVLLLLTISVVTCVFHINKIEFNFYSLYNTIRNLSYPTVIFINSVVQSAIFILLLLFLRAKKYTLIKFLFIADLTVNTFLCTPFFTVSSYSLKEVNDHLKSVAGFPVQAQAVNKVPAQFEDDKNNIWYHLNVFKKQVSSNHSYWGPLVLKNFSAAKGDSLKRSLFNHPLVYANDIPPTDSLQIIGQRPTLIKVKTDFQKEEQVVLLQNYFPGWKARYNDRYLSPAKSDGVIRVTIPAGKGEIDFIYDKKIAWYAALLLHLLVICSLLVYAYQFLMRFFRSRQEVTKLSA